MQISYFNSHDLSSSNLIIMSCENNPHWTNNSWLRWYSQIYMYHLEAENVQKIKKERLNYLEVYDLENVFLVEGDVLSVIEKHLHWADWKRVFIRHCLCWWTVKCASIWKINLFQISIWSTMFCEDASEKKERKIELGQRPFLQGLSLQMTFVSSALMRTALVRTALLFESRFPRKETKLWINLI